jgi:hypothetical protein
VSACPGAGKKDDGSVAQPGPNDNPLAQLAMLGQHLHRQQMVALEHLLVLGGRSASIALAARDQIDTLADAEFKVSSQTGEDGIIEWLVQRVPTSSRRFIEFGVESYAESNTRYLLRTRHWKGLVFDASAANIEAINGAASIWMYDLTARSAFITRENINELIAGNGFTGGIGLLSIDIDGNDYWVWEAIDAVSPDIVICEYNAVFGDLRTLTIPYQPTFQRHMAHHSHLYYGASIGALTALARRKGYELVGTTSSGHNAFFVRGDLASGLAIRDRRPRPSLIRESRDEEGRLTYAAGRARLDLIKAMPVVDVTTGETAPLESFGALYSDDWLKQLGA